MNTHALAAMVATATFVCGPGFAASQVSAWNSIMRSTVADQNAFFQARYAAITQLAVFEAVNAIVGQYKPYVAGIAAPEGASAEAAVVAAAHVTLKNYFPASAAILDAARAASLATIPDGTAKNAGIAVGEAAAAMVIALRANDGSATPMVYTPLTGPGFWAPTPPAFGPAAFLHWANVTPFGLVAADQFRCDPPPPLTSGAYRRDYDEVKQVGGVTSALRPADRTEVARYFAATSAMHVWNQAATQVSDAEGESLSRSARALAILNMAISDGAVASMDSKYHYHLWRPVTAIRAGDTDGNSRTEPDSTFTPLIATPAFPSYPSAHASASYAGREVLERLYGAGQHSVTLSNPTVPGVILNYTRFRQITDDIDDARVFGGIHFRFDQEAGAEQGRRVGRYVDKHLLQCAKGNECDEGK